MSHKTVEDLVFEFRDKLTSINSGLYVKKMCSYASPHNVRLYTNFKGKRVYWESFSLINPYKCILNYTIVPAEGKIFHIKGDNRDLKIICKNNKEKEAFRRVFSQN